MTIRFFGEERSVTHAQTHNLPPSYDYTYRCVCFVCANLPLLERPSYSLCNSLRTVASARLRSIASASARCSVRIRAANIFTYNQHRYIRSPCARLFSNSYVCCFTMSQSESAPARSLSMCFTLTCAITAEKVQTRRALEEHMSAIHIG